MTAQGLLIRKPGVGTYLACGLRLNTGIEKLESVLSIAHNQGLTPEIRDLSITTVHGTSAITELLNCPVDTLMTLVCRTIHVSGTPVSLHYDYIPIDTLSPNDFSDQFNGSVLDLLTIKQILPLKEAKTEITAFNANKVHSLHLKVNLNSALILLKETVYNEAGSTVSYSENFFVPERFYLHVLRRKYVI